MRSSSKRLIFLKLQCIRHVIKYNPHLSCQWSINREHNSESLNWGNFDSVLIGDEEYIQVSGPGAFSFTFSKSICEFSSYFRWYSFIEDSELQLELRNICQEVAEYFGYEFSIYMGDNYCASDYVYEGREMQYYKTSLKKRFGEPKNTISELIMQTSNGWTSKGYYIDYFSDLTI